MRKQHIVRISTGAAVLASLALGGTAAVAVQGTITAAEQRMDLPQGPAPEYQRNDSGLTYGSAAKAISPETEPDLIAAVGDDGTKGYVYTKQLNYQPQFKSPDEAVAWQRENGGKAVTIDLYDQTGKTKVGTFTVTPPTTSEIEAAQGMTRK